MFHAEELVARNAWSRFCGALGAMFAITGAMFVVVTLVCMMLMVSDGTAGWTMGAALLFLVVIMAFWTWAYFDRFGSYGILPEREDGPDAAVNSQAASGTADFPPGSTVFVPSTDSPEETGAGTTIEDEPPVPGPTDPDPDASTGEDEETEGEVAADDDATASSDPIMTPEERLASATTPINHESTEADLGSPIPSSRRPRHRRFHPSRPDQVPEDDAEADASEQQAAAADDPPHANEEGSDTSGSQTSSSTEGKSPTNHD